MLRLARGMHSRVSRPRVCTSYWRPKAATTTPCSWLRGGMGRWGGGRSLELVITLVEVAGDVQFVLGEEVELEHGGAHRDSLGQGAGGFHQPIPAQVDVGTFRPAVLLGVAG